MIKKEMRVYMNERHFERIKSEANLLKMSESDYIKAMYIFGKSFIFLINGNELLDRERMIIEIKNLLNDLEQVNKIQEFKIFNSKIFKPYIPLEKYDLFFLLKLKGTKKNE